MKLFDEWNEIKKRVEKKYRASYSEGDIWMTNLGENLGAEETGKGAEFLRPVLVLKKFNAEFSLCVPLSTTEKEGKYYHHFSFKGKVSNGLLSQVRSTDAKRFKYRLGKINKVDLADLKTKTRNMIP